MTSLEEENNYRHNIKRTPPTPRTVYEKLMLIQSHGHFDLKMLDHILQSLLITKTAFVLRISVDKPLTAKFLYYFPSSREYINYSEITLLAHVLICAIDFDQVDIVDRYRKKINGADIWSINKYGSGVFFDIIKKITERISKEEAEEVKEELRSWYAELVTKNIK